jgi:hypothetical protein
MQNKKKLTFDVHLNNKKMPLIVAQTSHMTSLQVYDLSTHFIGNLSIIGDYLIRNNIFLDKAYELFTYLFKIC